MSHIDNHRIRVDIVSGFLGAGKTTLIRKLIEDKIYGDKLVVLENEFGAVDVDGELLQNEMVEVESIVASCICCTGADTLTRKLTEIATRNIPKHLIIEPTGIARLSDIRRVFLYPEICNRYYLGRVITIVDALNYNIWLKVSKDFFDNQIKFSDYIYISKIDKSGLEQLEHLVSIIKQANPNAILFSDIQSLLKSWNELKCNDKQRLLYSANTTPDGDLETFSITISDNLVLDKLKSLMAKISNGEFGSIYRIKGSVYDDQVFLYSVNFVGSNCEIDEIKTKDCHVAKLTIIGRNLIIDALKAALEKTKN